MVHISPLLLIDDDEDYINLMRLILEGEGYSVDYAINGYEGVLKFESGKYVAVITDYIMPIMKGDEVAERIRRIDEKVGLILLTGYKSGLPNETLNRFNFVIEKPASPLEILHALSALTVSAPQILIEVTVT